jgi:hypothetical protein
MFWRFFPASGSPAPIYVKRRLHYCGVIAHGRWAIARAVSVSRVSLDAVNEDPVHVVMMIF